MNSRNPLAPWPTFPVMTNLHLRSELQPPPVLAPRGVFRRVFVPWRLFAGLGLTVMGVVTLVAMLVLADRIRISTLLLGPFFIAAGIGLMVSCWAKGCAACRTPLDETSTVFPLEAGPHVNRAVAWSGQGGAEALVRMQGAPLAPAPRQAALLMSFCPSCRAVAEIASATCVRLPDGGSTHEELSAKMAVVGPAVGRVLDMIGQRNTAMTHAMYGGPLPP